MWRPGSLPRGAKWGTGPPCVQLQGVTTLGHGQCRWILQRSIHDGCGPRQCSTHGLSLHSSRRPSQSELKGNNGATTPGLPSLSSLSLTIPFLQDTNFIVSSGSSSPDKEFSSVSENVTCYPLPVVTLPHSRVSTPLATPSSHSPDSTQSIQPTGSKTPDVESTSLMEQPLATSESELAGLSKELLQLQWRVTTALRELFMVRASADYCHREPGLKAELATCQNDAWLAEAEAWLAEADAWHVEAKAQHADTATTLQQAHLNSIATLDWEMMTEEEQKHQAFAEEFSAALEACLLEDHWALMYPIQLMAGGISLAPLLEMPATTQPQVMADIGSVSAPLALETPAPIPNAKWQHPSSSQDMPNVGQEGEASPHKKWKPLARALREAHEEAFSKDSEVVKVARQNYHLTHRAMFAQVGSYDLTSVFWEMAWERRLLNVEIYEVQELGPAGRGWRLPIVLQQLPKGIYSFSAC